MHATVSSRKGQPGAEPGAAAAPDDLVRSLSGFAKFLLHAGGRDFYRAVGELDLSISQIRTLHLLTGPLPEASLKTLADEIGLSMPAVSRSVEALVQRGLVTRTENAEDRRHKAVRATPEAQSLVDHLIELRVAGIQDFVGTLTDSERADLAEALAPIVAREDVAPLCIARKDSRPNA
jgi:DNA-binding MarR family transcriptional regulator